MSNNIEPIQTVAVIDPVVNINQKPVYGVYDAGLYNTYSRFPSQSTVNNVTCTITCNPPNEKTVIHPKVFFAAPINIQFTGDAGVGNTLLQKSLYVTDAPRAMPLNTVAQSTQATLNGFPLSNNTSEFIQAFARYNFDIDDFNEDLSTMPSMLDQYQTYQEAIGSSRNPLANYDDNSAQIPRGAFPLTIISDTRTTAEVQFTSFEPLFLSPFYFNKKGIIGIRTFTLQWLFSNINRVWSQSANSLMTISSVTIGTITAYFRYITPKMTENIPKAIQYNYNNLLSLSTSTSGAINAGAQFQLTISATNLSSIPRRIMLYCKKLNNLQTEKDTDTFARIDSIADIQWVNRKGILTSASTQELYQLAKAAGINYSYTQWVKYIGSVLALDVASAFGLDDLSAPGALDNPQFSVTLNMTNISSQAIQFVLYAYVISEGILNIENGSVSTIITPLSKRDVLKSEESAVELVAHEPKNFYGGDFFEDLHRGVKKIMPYVKTGIDVARIIGGKKKKKNVKGRALIGGKMLDRNDLVNNLRDLELEDSDYEEY